MSSEDRPRGSVVRDICAIVSQGTRSEGPTSPVQEFALCFLFRAYVAEDTNLSTKDFLCTTVSFFFFLLIHTSSAKTINLVLFWKKCSMIKEGPLILKTGLRGRCCCCLCDKGSMQWCVVFPALPMPPFRCKDARSTKKQKNNLRSLFSFLLFTPLTVAPSHSSVAGNLLAR